MNITVRRTALLLGSLALLAGHGPAAQAATWKKADPSGDVTVVDCTDPEDESTCVATVNGGVADGDVVATTITHGSGRVVITTKYRGLTTKNARLFLARVVTNEGVVRDVFAGAAPGSAQPGVEELRRKDGSGVRCGKLNVRVDMPTHRSIISVPRSCLSYPRWVKVDQTTVEIIDDNTFRGDESFRTGPLPSESGNYAYSAQVRNN